MIAREAEALCSEVSTPALLNHCLRSYAWGTILAERDGLQYDPELLCVTCLLHDLGVTDRYRDTVTGQACFAPQRQLSPETGAGSVAGESLAARHSCAQADQHHGTRIHFLFRYMQFGARIRRAPYDD